MSALYVCLICLLYMSALYVCACVHAHIDADAGRFMQVHSVSMDGWMDGWVDECGQRGVAQHLHLSPLYTPAHVDRERESESDRETGRELSPMYTQAHGDTKA